MTYGQVAEKDLPSDSLNYYGFKRSPFTRGEGSLPQRQIDAGETTWNAIINAAVLRFRPIMLTAAAAILGMLPLALDRFWGPMAVAIGGGLFGATILTLIVLPCMYAAWYRVKAG